MKVAIISTTPPPVGGISRWTERMLNLQLPNNWEIVLVDDKPINRESFGDNIRRNYWNEIKRGLRIWRDLISVLSDDDIRVVHACPIASLPSLLLAYINCIITHFKKKKFIVHFRCTVPNMITNNLQKVILKFLCNSCDYIIVLNEQTKNYIEKFTKKEIDIVPNFVDLSFFENRIKVNQKIESVVYVGGVTKEKGCLNIVKVAKKFPDITFKLIGKEESALVEFSNDIKNVVFYGVLSKEEVKKELYHSDLFIFLSKYPGEGFSNALAEAMAAGLPCIVTDWAANADMIEEEKGGYVCQFDDNIQEIEDLIKKSESFINRNRQSKYNFEKARKYYNADIILNKYIEIYEKLV